MAMYYQSSSEMQADGLHTLYLMNPNYAPYSDAQPNMLFFNPASSSSSAAAVIPHAPLHHFTGIPLSHDPSRSLPPTAALARQQDIPAAAAQTPIHYNTWGLVDQPPQTPRGLSLSLSAHHQAARAGFDKPSVSGDHGFPTGQSSVGMKSPESNGANSMNILGSKYLKAAQEVLEEVVSFDPGAAAPPRKEKAKAGRDNTGIKSELTTAQRQEIQMKKSKLHSMLDEVEQRCRQYHEQMQIVVTAFEQAAGSGSARAYTQLALKTILKQFRCLKSTISAQIKGLGDDESSSDKGSRGLKFVDSQLRQQRALQQLGMMQNNAWRPQRGLPERAVSVLRAWLFEHFLHPYPKDSDKQMLAKQTGLTRSQVSNWFINARVRLWKPMVEEMYLEETKNQHDAPIKPELPDNKPAACRAAASPAEISISASTLTTASPSRTNFAQLISSLNMDSQLQAEKNPKKARNAAAAMNINEMTTENYLSMSRYGIDNQQAAAAGNSFSLSLALQPAHHDSSQQQQFLSHRNLVEGGEGSSSINNIGYEILDFQNRRKQFPAQLLPDFVT